jgi:DNA-binding transcriptional ArsR family regulator
VPEEETLLRIHFTAQDLARTHMIALGPLALAQLAAPVLGARDDSHLFGRWRAAARGRLTTRARHTASWLFPHLDLPQVDLITLAGAEASAAEAAENLLAAPRTHLHAEVSLTALRGRRPPSWLRQLASGDRDARLELVQALRELQHASLDDRAERIHAVVDAEHNSFGRIVAAQGIGAALGRVHPGLRWDAPVLSLFAHADGDLHLEGRGMLLAPSVFCRSEPQLYIAHDQQSFVLVYPALRDAVQAARLWGDPAASTHAAVAALLGRTRAAILAAIAHAPTTTTNLARLTGVSTASASEHATALRAANLIATHRSGASVVHSATPLGTALLDGDGG